jgi:purine-binding chemotaxis protein CheW
MRFLLFYIETSRYAVPAESVGEIVRAVAVTALPGAPSVVDGVIDVRGTVMPVFSLRRRFGLHDRAVEPNDQFIIVRTPSRSAALHVDRAEDLIDIDRRAIADPSRQMAGAPMVGGVALLDDGLALIYDVETFLSRAESDALDSAMVARA